MRAHSSTRLMGSHSEERWHSIFCFISCMVKINPANIGLPSRSECLSSSLAHPESGMFSQKADMTQCASLKIAERGKEGQPRPAESCHQLSPPIQRDSLCLSDSFCSKAKLLFLLSAYFNNFPSFVELLATDHRKPKTVNPAEPRSPIPC